MSLAVVLDMDTRWWCSHSSGYIIESLKYYISFMGNSTGKLEMSVYACFADGTETVVSGDWSACVLKLEDELESLIARRKGALSDKVFETPIAQGISKGVLFTRRHSGNISSRIIVFECSRETVDFSSQSVALSNCGWSTGNCRVHVVSLGSDSPSSNLLLVCSKTGGVHIPRSMTGLGGKLVQSMLFHLCAADDSVTRVMKTRPQSNRTHMGTTCVCHNKPMDKGYVCSICLAIYCSETGAICGVCGSRFRREAKEEAPLRLQMFSKLFSLQQ
jgi:hypothetical protein